MMNALVRVPTWIASHWRTTAALACAIGIAVACTSYLETDEARNRRSELDRKKEIRRLADRILAYGRRVHERYPTGDVVLTAHDLGEQLRKRPQAVATALHLLLDEQKVQRAPMKGYWKLNV
jgi:hypothetical protein